MSFVLGFGLGEYGVRQFSAEHLGVVDKLSLPLLDLLGALFLLEGFIEHIITRKLIHILYSIPSMQATLHGTIFLEISETLPAYISCEDASCIAAFRSSINKGHSHPNKR